MPGVFFSNPNTVSESTDISDIQSPPSSPCLVSTYKVLATEPPKLFDSYKNLATSNPVLKSISKRRFSSKVEMPIDLSLSELMSHAPSHSSTRSQSSNGVITTTGLQPIIVPKPATAKSQPFHVSSKGSSSNGCTSSSPKSPLLEYWNKSHYRTFVVTKQRQRRRSSLCYSESLDYQESLGSNFSHKSSSHIKPPNSNVAANCMTSGQRPLITLCDTCKDQVEVPFLASSPTSLTANSDFLSEVDHLAQPLTNTRSLSFSSSPLSQPHPKKPHKIRSTSNNAVRCSSTSSNSYPRSLSRSFSHSVINKESLVGSYEESLLSGRMSAPCSPPVPFYLKLGVLGTDCPAKLKMPKHITTPFNAVFYDHDLHETGVPGKGSPYVGTVDLEKLFIQRHLEKQGSSANQIFDQIIEKRRNLGFEKAIDKHDGVFSRFDGRKMEIDTTKTKHQSMFLKKDLHSTALPFPGYRIPPKGNIQIIISNPQKTAVKLFLIPYDVSNLEYKQKTFLRYKVLLKNPQTDGSNTDVDKIHSRSNSLHGNENTSRADNNHNHNHNKNNNNKSMNNPNGYLLQAAHLQIARPFKNKYYLYGDLRLVFHNRADSNIADMKQSSASTEKKQAGVFSEPAKAPTLGYSKSRDNVVVSTVNGGKNGLRYKVEDAYYKILQESSSQLDEEEDSEFEEEDHKTFESFIDKAPEALLHDLSFNSDAESPTSLWSPFSAKEKKCNWGTVFDHKDTGMSTNTVNNLDNSKVCELCRKKVFTSDEMSTEYLENVSQTRQELDIALRHDMEAVSQKSYNNASGII